MMNPFFFPGMNLPCDIYHFTVLDSTNSKLKQWLPEKDTAIYTDFQTAGRGQGSHTWECPKDMGLLMSLLYYPKANLSAPYLLKLVAVVLCEVLEGLSVAARIKAPNDILVDEQKLAGILIENSFTADKLLYSIIGIGVNLGQTEFPQASSYAKTPVSLKQLGIAISREDLLKKILSHFYQTLALSPDHHEIEQKYKNRLLSDIPTSHC